MIGMMFTVGALSLRNRYTKAGFSMFYRILVNFFMTSHLFRWQASLHF